MTEQPERMPVAVHRGGGRSGLYRARLEQVTDDALSLVSEHTRGRMPRVRVVLTDGGGIEQLKQHAENDLVSGPGEPVRRPSTSILDCLSLLFSPAPLGQTVWSREGALVLINGRGQRDIRDLDRTLVHELVHCAQLNIPDNTRRHVAYVRQLYGVDPRSGEYGRYLRLAESQEAEAYDLESLAEELPRPPDGDDLDERL